MYQSHHLRSLTGKRSLWRDWVNSLVVFAALALICTLALARAAVPQVQPLNPSQTFAAGASTSSSQIRAPLMFVENVGQFAPDARYSMNDGSNILTLTENALWLNISASGSAGTSEPINTSLPAVQLKLTFVGANRHPQIDPSDRLDTHVAYFTGADASKWHTNVPVWGGVRYRDLYPGVDLELSGASGHLAARMIARQSGYLAPVRLRVEGADDLAIAGGSLLLRTAAGQYRLPLLTAVSADGQALPLAELAPVQFGNEIAHPFAAGASVGGSAPAAASDLVYSLLFGGGNIDKSDAMAVDPSGAAYIVGYTDSGDFPSTPGFVDKKASNSNATVVKVKPDGSGLEFAVVIGGSGIEYATGVGVDLTGNTYVAGYTASSDFPTVNGYDTGGAGVDSNNRDAFVFKLNPTASTLIFSTYFGGSGMDTVEDMAIDPAGAIYITGRTTSTDLPVTAGAYDQSYNGGDDIYVAKLLPSGANREYATYLGGFGNDRAFGIALDASGAAYIAGRSDSTNFPTVNAYATNSSGLDDAIVAKLNPSGTDLVYSTYLGGSQLDRALDIAVDDSGAAYVAGYTVSTDFPTSAGAYDRIANGGADDAFVAKLGPAGNTLVYSTYLGGNGSDQAQGIAVNGSGEAYVVGTTSSTNFPASPDAYSATNSGGSDIFVAKLNATGTSRIYASYLGSSGGDLGTSLALDNLGAVYLTGQASAANFPVKPAGASTFKGGAGDAFAAKLQIGTATTPKYSISGQVLDQQIPPAPVDGVQISAGGRSTVTDANGFYRLDNLDAGSLSIVPSKGALQFMPPSYGITLTSNLSSLNFTVITPQYRVSGRVHDTANVGIAGVTISAGQSNSATSDSNGNYSLLLPAGNYTLRASRSGYSFTPQQIPIAVTSAPLANNDFVGSRTTRPAPITVYVSLGQFTTVKRYCDDYEPNNKRAQAKTIPFGQTITAKICQNEGVSPPDPKHWDIYLVSVPNPAPIKIAVVLPASLAGHISLAVYDPLNPNAPLAGCFTASISSRPLQCNISDAGEYAVALFSRDGKFDDSATYSLTVTQ